MVSSTKGPRLSAPSGREMKQSAVELPSVIIRSSAFVWIQLFFNFYPPLNRRRSVRVQFARSATRGQCRADVSSGFLAPRRSCSAHASRPERQPDGNVREARRFSDIKISRFIALVAILLIWVQAARLLVGLPWRRGVGRRAGEC